jgi:uncharacterized protein (DUF3820 family)
MSYGKYRGEDVKDVPAEYLEFIISEAEITITMMTKELERRKKAKLKEVTQ